jgi:hypothetical protein
VIGGTSYNELLSRLISLLGDDAPAAAAAALPQPSAASLASPPCAPAAAPPGQPADAAAAAAAASQPGQVTAHVPRGVLNACKFVLTVRGMGGNSGRQLASSRVHAGS